jgi:hypothetical protein
MIAPSLILFFAVCTLASLAFQGGTLAQCILLRKNRDVLFPRKRFVPKPKRKL